MTIASIGVNFGSGEFRVVSGTNPAANTEVSETIAAATYWEVVAVKLTMVQGLTQTPQPILLIDDGTTVIYESFGSSAAQAASTTCVYTFAAGLALSGQVGTGANVHSHAPLPAGLILGPGYRVRTSTLGIGANSDYGVPVIYVVEYA
jgi:hypothetical protein